MHAFPHGEHARVPFHALVVHGGKCARARPGYTRTCKNTCAHTQNMRACPHTWTHTHLLSADAQPQAGAATRARLAHLVISALQAGRQAAVFMTGRQESRVRVKGRQESRVCVCVRACVLRLSILVNLRLFIRKERQPI